MVKKLERKYVTTKTVKGRVYYYFRRGETYQRLPNDPDSQEFDDAYWAIRSGRAKKKTKTTFEALIVSTAFEGKRLIARHQLVYKALGDRMKAEIHALSMRTLTPDEYKANPNG